MPDCYYEVLSVLHVMAVLGLMQANLLLLPNTCGDSQTRTTEGTSYLCSSFPMGSIYPSCQVPGYFPLFVTLCLLFCLNHLTLWPSQRVVSRGSIYSLDFLMSF